METIMTILLYVLGAALILFLPALALFVSRMANEKDSERDNHNDRQQRQ